MSTKRPHTKSRSGCVQCKRRKVKCCESAPTCKRCQTRNERCSLQDSWYLDREVRHGDASVSSISMDDNSVDAQNVSDRIEAMRIEAGDHLASECTYPTSFPSLQATDSTASAICDLSTAHSKSCPELSTVLPSMETRRASDCLSLHHLQYLQHFILHTAHSMSFVPGALLAWTDRVPKLSYSNPFLLHQLLAIAASHKSYELYYKDSPTSQDLIEADGHRLEAGELQASAIKLYIPELGKACPETCVALLSFNVLFSGAVFGWAVVAKRYEQLRSTLNRIPSGFTPPAESSTTAVDSDPGCTENAPKSTSYLNCFINSRRVLQGNEAIIDEYWAWIQISEIRNLFTYPAWEELAPIPSDAEQSLEWIRVQVHQLPQHCHMSYGRDVLNLSRAARIAMSPQKCPNQAFVVDYAAKMCQENIAGLESHDALSLVMLGFWAACLGLAIDKNAKRWWAKGWAGGLIGEVLDILRAQAQILDFGIPHGWEAAMSWPLMTLEAASAQG